MAKGKFAAAIVCLSGVETAIFTFRDHGVTDDIDFLMNARYRPQLPPRRRLRRPNTPPLLP